jgi:8-oxo-dGTP pyrophosphatase MutT (NUDIX family)
MSQFRNPTHLLGLDRDPSLARLLRACGVEEAYISGGASDMDKFLALAEAMPLCQGHPRAEAVHRALQEETGLEVRLCPHTARAFWEAWVSRHWYGYDEPNAPIADDCDCGNGREPLYVTEVRSLPDPWMMQAESTLSLGDWTRLWESALAEGGETVLLYLPEGYRFVRPDPYHAGEAIRKAGNGTALTDGERDLLVAQALRVFGQWSLRTRWGGMLLLEGGETEAVTALLAYLQASRALAHLVWMPRDPAQAEAVSGLYAEVRTGVDCTACEDAEERMAAYRRVAPWGTAVVLRL